MKLNTNSVTELTRSLHFEALTISHGLVVMKYQVAGLKTLRAYY
jgi:hypothetical protein